MSDRHAYWNDFYAGRKSRDVPQHPSDFAKWVGQQVDPGSTLLEIGFGNGRDAIWFARQGFAVRGYDFAETAVAQAQDAAATSQLDAIFEPLDLGDASASARLGRCIASEVVNPSIYGRFLIHSLTDDERFHLLNFSALALACTGRLFLEFRTGKDQGETHLFGDDHFRMFLDPALVENELEERGARIIHSEAGHGLSVYRTEDPHVARIVASFNSS